MVQELRLANGGDDVEMEEFTESDKVGSGATQEKIPSRSPPSVLC